MNHLRIAQLIDYLETKTSDEHFDMSNWASGSGAVLALRQGKLRAHTCGTTACIAGYALHLFHPKTDVYIGEIGKFAAQTLDLPWDQAVRLFYGGNSTVFSPPRQRTRTEAIACLKNLLETGEVKWD